MRKLIAAFVGLIALLAVVAIAGVLYVRSASQDRSGEVTIQALDGPVEVLWDERGVPQIWAGSLHDALLAQGFLHARDRLWQMEVVRRAIQGRLAEVLGEGALPTDRFMRRLGLWRATEAEVDAMSPEERSLVEAYAHGVNAALDGWSGALPPEFLALRFEPDPWTARHSLAVAKLMSFTLAAYTETVELAEAVRGVGPEKARYLAPGYFDWGADILVPPPPEAAPPLASALVDGFSVAAASNAWVVSKERSRTGSPLLANDPHLGLQAPSLWYLIGMHASGDRPLDVVGVSIPGSPMVILGHNRAIAWGMTNAYVDDVDLFIERLDPADSTRYLTPGGSEPFEVVAETLHVKGRDEPEVLRLRRTRHGPVVSADGWAGAEVLSARWTAHDPSTVLRGILGFNLASGWDEFVAAVDAMNDPHQNLVYADTAGHIGYWMGGTVPIRGDRRAPPLFPVPGWTGEWDWTGTLPFEEHPHALDPPRGYVVTANNRQAAGGAADLVTQSWMLPFRAMRIEQMIQDAGPLDAETMHAMQLDLLDLQAVRYLDRAVDAAEAVGAPDAVELLRRWDGRATADSRAAALFYLWYGALRRDIARDLHGEGGGYMPYAAVAAVLEARTLPWLEHGEAVYRDLAAAGMRDAVEGLEGRTWGQLNHVVHDHTLGGVDLLDRILGLNVGPHPHYGSPNTVNVAHYGFLFPQQGERFTTTSGPSMRHVVDLGNLDGAGGFVIGTGQSGIPFSGRYADQRELWSEGGLWLVPLSRAAVEARAVETLILSPSPEG